MIPIDQEWQDRFDTNHGFGAAERFLALLSVDCNTFASVGREFNLSRERTRLLYERHVRPYLQKDGRTRIAVCSLNNIDFSLYPQTTLLVWRAARRAGLSVSPVREKRTSSWHTYPKELSIDGQLCFVSEAIPHYVDETAYITAKWQLKSNCSFYQWAIYPVTSSRIFILSAALLTRALYLRAYKTGGRRWSPNDRYLNAWHQLRQRKVR